MAAHLPNQYHQHALEVDAHLRVIGAPLGTLYAIGVQLRMFCRRFLSDTSFAGDAATVETNLVDHLLELVDEFDQNKDDKVTNLYRDHLFAAL